MRAMTAFSLDDVVVGRSARMRAVFDFVRVIGDSHSSVLVTGEPVSCALFSDNLIETELFGHERGAFTGAVKDRPGRFELADGGTIFLDDIDDVPLSVQVKLLRVLQNRTIERVGGGRSMAVDVRVVTGAKRDLGALVAAGAFREDLYYRLNVLPIVLPPLRERREDIPVLMEHFLRRFFRARGEDLPAVAAVVRQAFVSYPWPGNVRELENACERIAQTCQCGTVRVGCVASSVLFQGDGLPPAADDQPAAAPADALSLDDRLREVEANLITWALRVSTGNKSKAAELLNIKRSTLGDRINRCGLGKLVTDGAGDAPPAAGGLS